MDTKLVEKAINLWIQLTGKNPEIKEKIFKIDFFANPDDIGDYEVNKMNEELKDAMAFDSSLVSFVSLLRADAQTYASGTKYTLADMSDVNSEACRKVWLFQELSKALTVTDEEKERMDGVVQAMSDMGREPSDALSFASVAKMFVFAKKGINKNLDFAQFTTGQYSQSALHVFNSVYLCESASELVGALVHAPSNACVALAFIHNRELPQSSFFAFGIKNGGNVYLLADRMHAPNPNFSRTTRCPSRSVEETMKRARFPYSLVDFDLSNRYTVKDNLDGGKAIVKRGTLDFPVLGKFKDMTEDEFLYAIFMISNINKKFFENHVKVDNLSYTFAQVDTPLLAMKDEKSLVPYSENRIALAPIRAISDTDNLAYHVRGYAIDSDYDAACQETNEKVVKHYSYLFERYADKIHMNAVQPVGAASGALIGERVVEMVPVDGTGFYTKDELEYVQKWLFRENYAEAVRSLNRQECAEKHEALSRWFEDAVSAKKDDILLRAVRGELEGDFADHLDLADNSYKLVRFGGERSIVAGGLKRLNGDYWDVCFDNTCRHGYRCSCISDKPAYFFVQFRCGTWRDLCSVLGLSRDELPVELQHYDFIHAPRQEGNSILDNLDPLSGVFDEFNKLHFSVTYYFGKGELLKFVRETGGDVAAAKKLLTVDKQNKVDGRRDQSVIFGM